MTKQRTELVEIGILCHSDVQLAALYGLTDLFLLAERLNGQSSEDSKRRIRVTHWQQTDEDAELACIYDSNPQDSHNLHAIIVPPSLSEQAANNCGNTQSLQWLRDRHAQGVVLCSVCAGVFTLAETGLLNGRTVTTHWCFLETFSNRYPDTELNLQKLIIDDGDIVTAGGLMAWTDLGLNLLDRFLGPSLTLKTARFLLIDPAGREQQHYRHFQPLLDHGDLAILKVQRHLQKTNAFNSSVSDMSSIACLENRTFLRRFQRATGYKPTEYCQQLSVEKAREKLELSGLSVEKIAWESCYKDTSAFRRVFKKIVGLNPSEYRRRFGLSARKL